MNRPALPLIYKANAFAAIALGVVLIFFASRLKHLYWGQDAAVDLIRTAGIALVALAIVTLTVVHSAGSYFLTLARFSFGWAFLMTAPITILPVTWSGFGWTVAGADLLLILSLFYWPNRSGYSLKRDRSDWQEEIRETASRQERTRLAEELHDSIKQQLFSIQANLAAAEARWETDQPAVQEAIGHARSSTREALAETTAMLDQLQAAPLESVGLVEALRRQCEALSFRTGAKVETHFIALSGGSSLSSTTQATLFRIAQEALSNIARHARAKNVRLELGADIADPVKLRLQIQDDGVGLVNDNLSSGSGFANMRSRAEKLGGQLTIFGPPGQGCTISVVFDPWLEDGKGLSRYRGEFFSLLGLGCLFLVVAWDKRGDKAPEVSSYIWGFVLLCACGVSGWRYLRLRDRVRNRAA